MERISLTDLFPRWRYQRIVTVLVVLLLALSGFISVSAQGGTLVDGSIVIGTLTAESPAAFYTFNGNPGELVSAHIAGTTVGMNPTLSLLSPAQQPIMSSDDDPFGFGSDARITYRVRDPGPHFLLVGGTPGSFLLRFSVAPPSAPVPLVVGAPLDDQVAAGAPRTYTFNALADSPATLGINTATAGFYFVARVYGGNGQLIAVLGGPGVQAASLTLAPGPDTYTIMLLAPVPGTAGAVNVSVVPGGVPGSAGVVQPPPPTGGQPAQPTAPPPANVCTATPAGAGAVNVRGGPGTAYDVIGQISPGAYLTLNGRNADGSWYTGPYGGRQGWVAGSVTVLNGPCANLPVVSTPAPPGPVPTEEVIAPPPPEPVGTEEAR